MGAPGTGHGAQGTGYRHHELSDSEAKIYYDNYQRITAAVKAIASRNRIELILRIDSQEMDLDENDSVAHGVRRNVVYHDSTNNITDSVMRYLEQPTKTSTEVTVGAFMRNGRLPVRRSDEGND